MGTFTDLRKAWDDAKKKAPDQSLAKKTFTKGLGPVLTNLETTCKELSAARHKDKYNPEKIADLSPKVIKMCTKAKDIVSDYNSFARKQKWFAVSTAALAVEHALQSHATLEAKEWTPTKEYINLWKVVTLEMALSAAGLEDAKTADDLRKILDKKTKAINVAKQNDATHKAKIEQLSPKRQSDDYLKRQADNIVKGVAGVLALNNPDPNKLKLLVNGIHKIYDLLLLAKNRADADLKALKDYVKKPEVQASKKLGDDNVKSIEDFLKTVNDAITKSKPEMAKLPKVT